MKKENDEQITRSKLLTQFGYNYILQDSNKESYIESINNLIQHKNNQNFNPIYCNKIKF